LFQDTSRRYENKAGSFITGIDVTSKVIFVLWFFEVFQLLLQERRKCFISFLRGTEAYHYENTVFNDWRILLYVGCKQHLDRFSPVISK